MMDSAQSGLRSKALFFYLISVGVGLLFLAGGLHNFQQSTSWFLSRTDPEDSRVMEFVWALYNIGALKILAGIILAGAFGYLALITVLLADAFRKRVWREPTIWAAYWNRVGSIFGGFLLFGCTTFCLWQVVFFIMFSG